MGIQFKKLKKYFPTDQTHTGKTGSGKGNKNIFKVGPVPIKEMAHYATTLTII